jgi:Zn-dependent protease with chaperone function
VPASRFHDGQHSATHIVHAFVSGRELRIVGEGNVTLAAWRLDRVEAAPEIDPDGVVILTAPGQPGVLLIDDSAELATLRRAGVRLPGHRNWTRRHWFAVCAGLAATLGLGILALNGLPRLLAAAVPITWEQRLGEPAEATMTASKIRCTGTEGQAALDRLVARLRVAGRIEMPVTIAVLDDRTANAFTLPGGHVLVMRGLIDEATDGPMLAGVIAHELGHVAHRDSLTLLLRGVGLSILLHMIGFGDAGDTAAAGASNLMNLAYTRTAEAAADDTAIDLLTKADLRADGLSRFFARMEQREGMPDSGPGKQAEHKPEDRIGTTLNWFATHPSSGRHARTQESCLSPTLNGRPSG